MRCFSADGDPVSTLGQPYQAWPTLVSELLLKVAYYRVSTVDQTIDSQRHAMGGGFDREFIDDAVSGFVKAMDRPAFADMVRQLRRGDVLHVYAVDRLGRDALDIQATARELAGIGVTIHVHGLGPLAGQAGELILAVLAQVADGERRRIMERTAAGRATARTAMDATGRTHRGKESLGRPRVADPAVVAAWRKKNGASVSATARHFKIARATVKRYCAKAAS